MLFASATTGRDRLRRLKSVLRLFSTSPSMVLPPLTTSFVVTIRSHVGRPRLSGGRDSEGERKDKEREEGEETHCEGRGRWAQGGL